MNKQFPSKTSEKFENLEHTIRESLAKLVRNQRKIHKPELTQEELAYQAGISFEHLNHIENGKATPSITVLYRIAIALGFNRVSELLNLDDKEVL